MASMSPELAQAIIASAQRLGVDPLHIGTAISYETGGRFDPNLWGGKGGNHLGLIQFGPEERAKYGVKEGQTATEQMGAVENFLRDRGVKPGMGLMDIYSTINAGAPGLYNRSDANNGGAPGTVADKVNNQMARHAANVAKMLGPAPVGALATADGAVTAPASAGAGVVPVGALASGPASPDAPVMAQGPAGATAGVGTPSLASQLGGVGKGLSDIGGKMQEKPEFLEAPQIEMPRTNASQSQQIAAALAQAYGLNQPENPTTSVFPSPWNRSGRMGY